MCHLGPRVAGWLGGIQSVGRRDDTGHYTAHQRPAQRSMLCTFPTHAPPALRPPPTYLLCLQRTVGRRPDNLTSSSPSICFSVSLRAVEDEGCGHPGGAWCQVAPASWPPWQDFLVPACHRRPARSRLLVAATAARTQDTGL